MVRYHEIIRENNPNDIEEIKQILEDNFMLTDISGSTMKWVYDETFRIKNNKIELLNVHECTMIVPCSTFMVEFGHCVVSNFICMDTGLTSLKGFPTSIMSAGMLPFVVLHNNNLKSLEGLPISYIETLELSNNNFQSLAGIEFNSNISTINITYQENLPLLRLNLAKGAVTIKNSASQTDSRLSILNNIFKEMKRYSRIKERIIKCQYELIKAGFKGNAKW